jgi:hypothetical protein
LTNDLRCSTRRPNAERRIFQSLESEVAAEQADLIMREAHITKNWPRSRGGE